MTEIQDQIQVECSSSEAASYIGEMFERLGGDRDSAVLTLCVPIGDARISRDVIAHVKPSQPLPGYRAMEISWAPKGGGPYPTFTGTLGLSDDTPSTCVLSIRGVYGPPGGVIGAAFDAALGRRLAGASLHALLETFKTAIELTHVQSTNVAAHYLPTYE